jgi:hypothetical protein
MSDERREHPRVDCEIQCEIHLQVEGRERVFQLPTRDVSLGGVFLHAVEAEPVETELSMTLLSGEQRVSTRGTVVHSLQGVGFGIRFSPLAPAESAVLGGLLASLAA